MTAGKSSHVHHYHRHLSLSYPVSLIQRLYTILLAPLLAVLLMLIVTRYLSVKLSNDTITFRELIMALGATLGRLAVAYVFAVIVALPLALLATVNSFFESIFLPIFDILESVPVLAFFPVLILVFISFNDLNGAAIFILFLSMVWNLVFTMVGGINVIPKDIIAAAHVFGITGTRYFFKILIPSLIPQFVTGSILAVAQGWNLIIVAEVLHVYMPPSAHPQDLFGLGSLLVTAASQGQTNVFILSVTVMVLAIALLNFFVWQKLLHYAQRFRFE